MRRRTGSPSAASTPASRTESSSESARSESGGQHTISVVGPLVTVASIVLTTVDVSYTLTSTVINLKDVAMSRVQLALNVSDLDDAVRFYSALFGTGPAKVRPGYANFAVADPPLKLVLIEGVGEPGSLNHLGVEVATTDDVAAAATSRAGKDWRPTSKRTPRVATHSRTRCGWGRPTGSAARSTPCLPTPLIPETSAGTNGAAARCRPTPPPLRRAVDRTRTPSSTAGRTVASPC